MLKVRRKARKAREMTGTGLHQRRVDKRRGEDEGGKEVLIKMLHIRGFLKKVSFASVIVFSDFFLIETKQ